MKFINKPKPIKKNNNNKDIEIEIINKIYEDNMLEEINKSRNNHGKKNLKDIEKTEIIFYDETGEIVKNINTKQIRKV